jgi:geranylgeranyl pyrophosphate synthase
MRELGILLQIIDDVLDYEGDVARCEKNCLVGANGAHYLTYLIHRGDHLRQVFKRNFVMSAVIMASQEKAAALLKSVPDSSRLTACSPLNYGGAPAAAISLDPK